MDFQVWMFAIGLVLVLEGIGPLLFPLQWKKYLAEISSQNKNVLRRLGGSLVSAGIVLLIIFA
ncbi:DUF2065 family protein [Shewanella sp. 1_MG-2023]|uniref:DUF2065 domain-containing protein n=1 Tax=unclassified Shewanella TaxID=196818 RepID=UPI001E416BF4|nr:MULTISPECIES: DUF2065 family protein [unclassified Shewanella]MCC4834071.1 DUF2065 family protein [Shewanella sp. 10N.7]MDO6613483.1 DUF2065 family protein [Shewanella sp. 7_MG-2023]MDO6773313.1 DUF2065 family protein [Shewanella sp. 2_MG-2023]MDO6795964.1 DUF2065 family protein [Shewanella sp. 1_MG-2023]